MLSIKTWKKFFSFSFAFKNQVGVINISLIYDRIDMRGSLRNPISFMIPQEDIGKGKKVLKANPWQLHPLAYNIVSYQKRSRYQKE